MMTLILFISIHSFLIFCFENSYVVRLLCVYLFFVFLIPVVKVYYKTKIDDWACIPSMKDHIV